MKSRLNYENNLTFFRSVHSDFATVL